MHVLEHPLSSYAQKVKMMLREKGLDFTVEIPAGLGNGDKGSTLEQANVRVEVPTLIDGEMRVWDSSIILQYLEDKFPTPAMLPADPAARAKARMIEDVCDTQYEAINWGMGEIRWFRRAEGELAATMMGNATKQSLEIQAWLTQQLGSQPWFGGKSFGWADLCVSPFVNRSAYYKVGLASGSPLLQWLERVRQHPSVAKTFAEFDAAAAGMGEAYKRVTSGALRRQYRDHRLEWMIKSGGMPIIQDGLAKNNIRFNWPTD
ncbi:MAG: glutathione S-transferase family protein [Rhodospirillales bacterium]